MVENTIKEYFSNSILTWYEFEVDKKILFIGKGLRSFQASLINKGLELVTCKVEACLTPDFLNNNVERFDYLVFSEKVDTQKNLTKILEQVKTLLTARGRILFFMNNRLGLKYFCGDHEPHTHHTFDGIDNYRRLRPLEREALAGRLYTQEEMKAILQGVGLSKNKFYSVLPSLEFPQLIYAENYMPNENIGIRLFPKYNHPESVFIEEQYLYSDFIKNGMFHGLANAYIVECSPSGAFQDVNHATLSLDRGKKHSMLTLIRENKTVEKVPYFEDGINALNLLDDNMKYLKTRGVDVALGTLKEGRYICPFIEAETAMLHLQKIAKKSKADFIKEVDRFVNILLNSSESYQDEEGKDLILKKGFFDLVPLNACFKDGKYIFFDQEYCIPDYPASALIYRTLEIIYTGDVDIEGVVPQKYFMDKYVLTEKKDALQKLTSHFLMDLRNVSALRPELEKFEVTYKEVYSNRRKINFSHFEFQKIFVDIFDNTRDNQCIIFGSGQFAKNFISRFKNHIEITKIVDNNPDKWGTFVENIEVFSPEMLWSSDLDPPKVIICIKQYDAIMSQLNHKGINNYSVYDPHIEQSYALRGPKTKEGHVNGETKPYKTGYIAGVFDLFHVGHLNLIKSAKAHCEHLIVGVVSDKGVINHKGVKPFIPFEERIEIVEACKYVDQAVEIPYNHNTTMDAYDLYKFDCQFSGSDYKEDPNWLANRDYLNKRGSTIMFLPYTEKTSSTKIKSVIDKKLKNKENK